VVTCRKLGGGHRQYIVMGAGQCKRHLDPMERQQLPCREGQREHDEAVVTGARSRGLTGEVEDKLSLR
jgi:hypothetical protein